MKFPGQPTKPPYPKEPQKYVDLDVQIELNDGFHLFNKEEIHRQTFHLGFDVYQWMITNLDKLKTHLGYDDWGRDQSYIIFTIPAEEHLYVDPSYEERLKKYNTKMEQYPQKLLEWEKKYEEWKSNNIEIVEKTKQEKLEQARKLLREAGEL